MRAAALPAVRELLSKYDFPGDDTPIIKGSAKLAMEGDKGELGEGAILKLEFDELLLIATEYRNTANPDMFHMIGDAA